MDTERQLRSSHRGRAPSRDSSISSISSHTNRNSQFSRNSSLLRLRCPSRESLQSDTKRKARHGSDLLHTVLVHNKISNLTQSILLLEGNERPSLEKSKSSQEVRKSSNMAFTRSAPPTRSSLQTRQTISLDLRKSLDLQRRELKPMANELAAYLLDQIIMDQRPNFEEYKMRDERAMRNEERTLRHDPRNVGYDSKNIPREVTKNIAMGGNKNIPMDMNKVSMATDLYKINALRLSDTPTIHQHYTEDGNNSNSNQPSQDLDFQNRDSQSYGCNQNGIPLDPNPHVQYVDNTKSNLPELQSMLGDSEVYKRLHSYKLSSKVAQEPKKNSISPLTVLRDQYNTKRPELVKKDTRNGDIRSEAALRYDVPLSSNLFHQLEKDCSEKKPLLNRLLGMAHSSMHSLVPMQNPDGTNSTSTSLGHIQSESELDDNIEDEEEEGAVYRMDQQNPSLYEEIMDEINEFQLTFVQKFPTNPKTNRTQQKVLDYKYLHDEPINKFVGSTDAYSHNIKIQHDTIVAQYTAIRLRFQANKNASGVLGFVSRSTSKKRSHTGFEDVSGLLESMWDSEMKTLEPREDCEDQDIYSGSTTFNLAKEVRLH